MHLHLFNFTHDPHSQFLLFFLLVLLLVKFWVCWIGDHPDKACIMIYKNTNPLSPLMGWYVSSSSSGPPEVWELRVLHNLLAVPSLHSSGQRLSMLYLECGGATLPVWDSPQCSDYYWHHFCIYLFSFSFYDFLQ